MNNLENNTATTTFEQGFRNFYAIGETSVVMVSSVILFVPLQIHKGYPHFFFKWFGQSYLILMFILSSLRLCIEFGYLTNFGNVVTFLFMISWWIELIPLAEKTYVLRSINSEYPTYRPFWIRRVVGFACLVLVISFLGWCTERFGNDYKKLFETVSFIECLFMIAFAGLSRYQLSKDKNQSLHETAANKMFDTLDSRIQRNISISALQYCYKAMSGKAIVILFYVVTRYFIKPLFDFSAFMGMGLFHGVFIVSHISIPLVRKHCLDIRNRSLVSKEDVFVPSVRKPVSLDFDAILEMGIEQSNHIEPGVAIFSQAYANEANQASNCGVGGTSEMGTEQPRAGKSCVASMSQAYANEENQDSNREAIKMSEIGKEQPRRRNPRVSSLSQAYANEAIQDTNREAEQIPENRAEQVQPRKSYGNKAKQKTRVPKQGCSNSGYEETEL